MSEIRAGCGCDHCTTQHGPASNEVRGLHATYKRGWNDALAELVHFIDKANTDGRLPTWIGLDDVRKFRLP